MATAFPKSQCYGIDFSPDIIGKAIDANWDWESDRLNCTNTSGYCIICALNPSRGCGAGKISYFLQEKLSYRHPACRKNLNVAQFACRKTGTSQKEEFIPTTRSV